MDIDKSLQIAREIANEAKPVASTSTRPAAESIENFQALPASLVAEATKLVFAIAEGRDPFTSDTLSHHRPENNPETVRALCVVVTYLANQIGLREKPTIAPLLSDERGSMPLEEYLRDIEKREILRAIERARNNKTEAARILGITFRALRYKLEQFGIASE